MTVIGSVVSALGFEVIGILRFQIFVFLGLSNAVLPGVRVQHAPVAGESLLQFDLQAVRDGPCTIVESADFSNIRDCIEVEPAEVRGRSG